MIRARVGSRPLRKLHALGHPRQRARPAGRAAVEQPVAQRLGLGLRQDAVQEQQLGPGDQVHGQHDHGEPAAMIANDRLGGSGRGPGHGSKANHGSGRRCTTRLRCARILTTVDVNPQARRLQSGSEAGFGEDYGTHDLRRNLTLHNGLVLNGYHDGSHP